MKNPFKRNRDSIEKQVSNYFKLFNAYTPAFTSFEGSVYEMELTRAAIHSFATHVSKLKPEVKGQNNDKLARWLQYKPNQIMDTKKYLYRLATVYAVNNNVYIAPLLSDSGEVQGYYPLLPQKTQVINSNGERFLRYDFGNGNYGAIELEKCGLMCQYQYEDEFYGKSNDVLRPTIELINAQNQGIIEGVKASASIRFLAKLSSVMNEKTIKKEQEIFKQNQLSMENSGGVFIYDNKYSEIKPIESKPPIISASQLTAIKENVFNYFGTSEKILQNSYTSDEWNAYYEGKIEPFAIEASLVHTNMTFSEREIAFGNEIIFTANRLQYLSNNEKLNTVTQLFDRGFITHNQGLEIFNMASVEGGNKRYIRKEYTDYNEQGVMNHAEENGQAVQDTDSISGTNGTKENSK